MKRADSQGKEWDGERVEQNRSEARVAPLLELSRARNRSHDFYEHIRRKKIEDIVKSEANTTNHKYYLLKQEADRLSEKIKQKQELAKIAPN